ncbi:A/G-specific adenine glycosylase [Sulfurimonas autotrophica]|nr:A/G-specific adenine glycosylase [Sulfurimonas autotrophica]
MLQQTQVNRVRDEYYPQFLAKFPTLASLAETPLDDVLAAWSGLGYYSRARNLHKTAQLSQKSLPKTFKELLALPGIGQYTASAICSFGYEQNVPVVDTNIARVLKRYFALLHVKDKTVWEYAQKLLNHKEPRNHNLALMDLGSMVCLPKNPKCAECPLQANCQGKEEAELYTQKKKKEYESLELFYGILVQDDKIALTPARGNMYKNMLELPSVEPIEEDYLGSFKHAYTKYRLHVKLYKIYTCTEVVWVSIDELHKAPVSSLTKKALSTVLY